MNNEEEKIIFNNVLNDRFGYEFIKILIEELGAFERGVNFQNRDIDMFNRGKREKGQWLIDKIQEYDFEKYKQLMTERKNLWKKNKEQD